MAEKTVRVLDSQTGKIISIPASELAPGMVLARMDSPEGDLGEVYVDASTVETAPLRHPPFDDNGREFLRRLAYHLAEVCPRTVEDWEDGFRRDTHPEKEMLVWANIVNSYLHFSAGRVRELTKKQDIFLLLVSYFTNGPEAALATTPLRALSRKRAAEIVAEVESACKKAKSIHEG